MSLTACTDCLHLNCSCDCGSVLKNDNNNNPSQGMNCSLLISVVLHNLHGGNSGILPTPPLPHSHLLSYSSFSSSENSSSPPQQNGKIKLTRKITLILKGLKILSAASYPLGPQQAQSLHCKQETRDSWEEEEERRLWE